MLLKTRAQHYKKEKTAGAKCSPQVCVLDRRKVSCAVRRARKKLVASRSVVSAFTSEQQRRSVTFSEKETQRNERAGGFCKKVAASDMQLAETWWEMVDSNHRSH